MRDAHDFQDVNIARQRAFHISTLLTYLRGGTDCERAALQAMDAEDWCQVAHLAQEQSVAPLLFNGLKRSGVAAPEKVVRELNQAYRQNALHMLRMQQALRQILQRLQAQGIAVIVLKGAYLAGAVYEHMALRTMLDIDLLVKEEDLPHVDQEMLAFGARPMEANRFISQDNYHFSYWMPGRNFRVEIHWKIINPTYTQTIDTDGLWQRAQRVMLAQTETLALALEDLLVYLCLHTAKHAHTMRIRMFCDIAETLRHKGTELDWQVVESRARQWGALRPVYLMLRLAQDLLAADVPGDWLAALRPQDFDGAAGSEQYWEQRLDLIREHIFTNREQMDTVLPGSRFLSYLWGSKGLGGKLALIRARLLPSRQAMALKYPAPANSWRIFLYYPVHIKKVLLRPGRGMALQRLVSRNLEAKAAADHKNEADDLIDWLMAKCS